MGNGIKALPPGKKAEGCDPADCRTVHRVINESMPIVDARLENGARVNAVISPVALNGPILTIRRFPDTSHYNGQTDRAWKSYLRMCPVSESSGKGQVFYSHRRWYRKRQNYVSWSFV